ncbi:putative membrane protein [Bifidobacterium gallicum DSM 20093 = LMG 11596]|nr:putative membrane protein [Bifidobacterium gallicum DSM 20093 = LMG 11596]
MVAPGEAMAEVVEDFAQDMEDSVHNVVEDVHDAVEGGRAQASGNVTHTPAVSTGATPKLERFGRFGASRVLVGCLMTLVGGTLWGLNGTVSKVLLDTYHATPLWMACVRELLAGAMFLVVAALREPKQLKGALTTPRDYPHFLIATLTCVTLTQVAYLFSVHWTNGGTATVLQQVSLLMVLAYVCVHGRRWPHAREIIGIALAFTGVFLLVTGGSFTSLHMPLPGLLWGMTDAFSAACLVIVPISLINRWGNTVFNGITFMLSGLLLIPFAHPIAAMPQLDAKGWWMLAYSAICGTFLAFWLFMGGVERAGSMRTALLSTIEPVVATISTVLWVGTVFVPTDLFGIALILIMVVVMQTGGHDNADTHDDAHDGKQRKRKKG